MAYDVAIDVCEPNHGAMWTVEPNTQSKVVHLHEHHSNPNHSRGMSPDQADMLGRILIEAARHVERADG